MRQAEREAERYLLEDDPYYELVNYQNILILQNRQELCEKNITNFNLLLI